jgi:hypothetical protein
VQNKRRKGTSGHVLVEQTLLIGALIVGFLLLVPLYVSPAFSGALRSLGKLGSPVKGGRATSSRLPTRSTVVRSKATVLAGGRKIARRPSPSIGAAPSYVSHVSREVAVMLTADDREVLTALLATYPASNDAVLRARALMMAADGESSRFIALTLGIDEALVKEWRADFMAQPAQCGREGDRMACRRAMPWIDLKVEQPVVTAARSTEESR